MNSYLSNNLITPCEVVNTRTPDDPIILGGGVALGDVEDKCGIVINTPENQIEMSYTKIKKLDCDDINNGQLNRIEKKLDEILNAIYTLPQVVGHDTYKSACDFADRT